MKVALYICLSVILLGILSSNLISSYLFGYCIEFSGKIDVIYKCVVYIFYLGLSVLSLTYLFENKTSFLLKLLVLLLNLIYVPFVSLAFFVSLLVKWEDFNYNFSRLDKSEQIVLQINSGLEIDYREIYVYNLYPNFKIIRFVDSIELNGVWIKNEYRSDKLDTINYKKFMYKSEYNKR